MISRKLLSYWKELRDREEREVGVSKNFTISVLLVYPNVYRVAISNLAIHRIFELLNSMESVACDLFFLPETEDIIDELERGFEVASYYLERTPSEFDLILFSISYENDLLNVVKILRYFRIPPLSEDRSLGSPVLVGGGIAVSENPEPYAPIFDVLCIGEAENILDVIISEFSASSSRDDFLSRIDSYESIYVPSLYKTYRVGDFEITEMAKRLKRNVYTNFSRDPSKSVIHTDLAIFGKSKIIEISRGCPRKCKFCLASWLYGNIRFIDLETFDELIESSKLKRIGLMGTSISDWPYLVDAITRHSDRVFSFSSLRVDVKKEVIDRMVDYGVRTITFGVESFSESLRRRIGKPFSDKFLLERIESLSGKFETLKLYFMVGLPYESDDDVICAERLLAEIRRIFKGRITVNLSPFVPKPHTPFQFEAFCGTDVIKRRINMVRNIVRKIGGINLTWDLPKYAKLETIISRGDRRVGYWIAGKSDIEEDKYLSSLNPSQPYPWSILR